MFGDIREVQLLPWREPDRCPACGARAIPDSECAACGYRSQRALWKREPNVDIDLDLSRWITAGIVAVVLVAVAIAGSMALSGSRLAGFWATWLVVVTGLRPRRVLREAQWMAAFSMRWTYSDPVACVRAYGPGPVIEGCPVARYSRRVSITEVHSLDDASECLLRDAFVRGARPQEFESGVVRLLSLGAVRLFVEHREDWVAPVRSDFSVRGAFREARLRIARGEGEPGDASAIERALLEVIEPSSSALAQSDSARSSAYRALESGPVPASIELRRVAESVFAQRAA